MHPGCRCQCNYITAMLSCGVMQIDRSEDLCALQFYCSSAVKHQSSASIFCSRTNAELPITVNMQGGHHTPGRPEKGSAKGEQTGTARATPYSSPPMPPGKGGQGSLPNRAPEGPKVRPLSKPSSRPASPAHAGKGPRNAAATPPVSSVATSPVAQAVVPPPTGPGAQWYGGSPNQLSAGSSSLAAPSAFKLVSGTSMLLHEFQQRHPLAAVDLPSITVVPFVPPSQSGACSPQLWSGRIDLSSGKVRVNEWCFTSTVPAPGACHFNTALQDTF